MSAGEKWGPWGRSPGRADRYKRRGEEQGQRGTRENEPGTPDEETEPVSVLTAPPGQGRVLLEKLTPLTHPWNSTHTWIRNWRSWRGTQEMVEQVSQRLFPNDMNQIKNLNALPWPSKHENKRLLSPSKSPFILLVNTSESGRWHRVKATHSLKGSHPQPQFFICFWRYHCYSKLYFTMFIWQNFPRLHYEKKENNYFNQFWIMTVHLKV